jgi:hypothetical protein
MRREKELPRGPANSGKWLIFIPISQIDDVWTKIRLATEDGRLGDLAKVATAKTNPIATDRRTKVICVYTYDWTDGSDVRRVRQELHAGNYFKIPYKADSDTNAGRYSSQGHKRISKYYE